MELVLPAAPDSHSVRTLQGAPTSQAGSLPYACFLGFSCFYAFQWCYHFPHPICIFYTCIGECYWKCHLFQNCETTNADSLYQELQFTQSSNWGAFCYLQLHPTFPKLLLYRELFYASYNKPALNINAHFQCIWHFETVWRENLGKMLQRSNCKRNTLLFLLLIRRKTQVCPYCRLISY